MNSKFRYLEQFLMSQLSGEMIGTISKLENTAPNNTGVDMHCYNLLFGR